MKRIDEPKRYFGLTIDEFIPITMTMFFCYLMGGLLTGFVLATVEWLVLNKLKQGRGAGWMVCLFYWYLPVRIFFKTPSSNYRCWLG
jgi:type IV conjugative transfer system protein TraL